MRVVRLHAVRTPSKVLLPASVQRAAPVFFVVLHGFLAHSGAMNSFVVMLRNELDARNRAILENNDTMSHVTPFHITTLDARNHGLSPHTPTHVLGSLVEDVRSYLLHQLPQTVKEVVEYMDAGHRHEHDVETAGRDGAMASSKVRVIAIGHSMGSMTWAQYLMNQHQKQSSSANQKSEAATSAVQSPPDVQGFVSIDMPPITQSHIAASLVDELVDIIESMKRVEMHRISDLRSAHAEFFRCGMHDIRIRGLCTTNLALAPGPSNPARQVARWKCNVPVLERSIRTGELFFTDAYFKDPLPTEGTAAAAQERRRNEILTCPSVGSVPVLSILGGASPIGGDAKYGNVWERYALDLEQHTIPGAAHTVYYDKPRETISLVMSFLKRIHVL
ncbi:putative mitochondrial hypothetical protein [Leptomonas pyrrhocoris]|uniref:AB hydrolase-1 domain-containing protein n=1 Tax=Leptomonas pyrrhocoris TaxID=157538 RepID=A0A0M9GBK3_LEPPY|nr:putative mitochondrial hypothetical protein [Leptomonas pyrrhocoris]KPA86933.1 putative mitochondrial hypothetical protein [Leptomonas pyrrhocoris]|eukprot:XP_015665372.1 putative mitochondrial hypothetical protein [Leptomonas pyrrhocoris]